jgi:hypothetical protein
VRERERETDRQTEKVLLSPKKKHSDSDSEAQVLCACFRHKYSIHNLFTLKRQILLKQEQGHTPTVLHNTVGLSNIKNIPIHFVKGLRQFR